MKRLILIAIVMPLLFGCAGLQKQWEGATQREKATIILNEFQILLDSGFDGAKVYVSLHPEKWVEWKAKVLPLFDLTNKAIASALQSPEKLTVAYVLAEIQPRIGEVMAILTAWGVVVEGGKGK